MELQSSLAASDEQLWRLSREGDREAFSRIVERYQVLVCSLAYSACGSVATSEDLAQETFLTAWRGLCELREPQKLRHWLCGIARNLAANAVRRDLRRGGHPASLEAAADEASPDADPATQAATREEEALLWRTLANMPENYRIRTATLTTDDAYAEVLAAQGKQLSLPKYFESNTRLLGLPLFAIAWGGNRSDRYRPRTVCGWIAVGDIAVSPLLAFGGFAVAPIAVGGITAGVLSLSVFWGVAVGVFAVGSLAFGWWALGCAAAGVKCAVGFAAVARDYAVGIAVSAAEAGTPAAMEWVKTQWFSDFIEVMLYQAHWWILLCVVIALGLRAWQLRWLTG